MPVQRRSLKDQVKQQILERILRGRYAPGERLREVALAKELHTSPIPVREALRELVSLRVVESEAYKGVRVRQFTPNELKQAYELRAVLEGYAAEKGAHNLKGKTQPLHKRYLAMLTAARAGNIEAYAQNDIPFHRLIVEAAENAFLFGSGKISVSKFEPVFFSLPKNSTWCRSRNFTNPLSGRLRKVMRNWQPSYCANTRSGICGGSRSL